MSDPTALIKSALDAATDLVSQGENPTDALYKVSSARDLSPNFVARVGEALNVCLTYNHMKTAAARDSDFPIADIPGTVSRILTGEKKASIKLANSFETESIDFNKYLTCNKTTEKQASLKDNTVTTKHASPNVNVLNRYFDVLRDLEKVADDQLADISLIKVAYHSKYLDVLNYFTKRASLRDTWNKFETDVLSIFSEDEKPYLDNIYKSAGLTEPRGVKAEFKADNLSKVARDYVSFVTDRDTAKMISDARTEVLNKLAEFSNIGDITKEAAAEEPGSRAKAMWDVLGSLTNTGTNIIRDWKGSISKRKGMDYNPVRNMERRLVLQELIHLDPFLSKQKPEEVVRAYEQLVRLAPELAREKEIVRAMLHKMLLTPAMDTYTSDMLLGSDIKLMQRKQESQQYNNPETKSDPRVRDEGRDRDNQNKERR